MTCIHLYSESICQTYYSILYCFALPSGSIEVSNTSAKTAKQINVIAEGGSSDDDAAAQGFEAASKKIRVSAVDKDDEIILTLWLQLFKGVIQVFD